MARRGVCLSGVPPRIIRISLKGLARVRLYQNASMKITRQTTPDSVPDAARLALFLNVFIRQPAAPRVRNLRGR
jgi:hypothetical protein